MGKTDIVLIQPKTGPYDSLTWGKLPLGLLCVAAIPHQKGYRVEIIDQRFDRLWPKTLKRALDEEPICAGITAMTGTQIRYALQAARIVKEYSKTPIGLGGIHCSLTPFQSLQNPWVDFAVVKEGEYAFFEVIEALKAGRTLTGIPGVWYKENGQIKCNGDRPLIGNLDDLPELPLEIIDMDRYLSRNLKRGRRSIDIETSRGCPYNCAFCFNQVFNERRWRAMSARETVRRLTGLVRKYQIEDVFFTDDNFAVNPQRLREICIGIIEEKLDITWHLAGMRADMILRMDDSLLDLLLRSGCRDIYIGAESGCQEILDIIDKSLTVGQIVEANLRLARYPFTVKYSLIIGFPGETKEQQQMTIDLALQLCEENPGAYAPLFVFTPYPGTRLYEMAVAHGFRPPTRLEEWANFSFDNWNLMWPSWYSTKEARRLNSISFTSAFLSKNAASKIDSQVGRWMFSLYAPIGRWRFKHGIHEWPVETVVSRRLLKYM